MKVYRAEIVARLRATDLKERADWVERTLPEAVDTIKNASLFQTLGIDPASMTPVEPDPVPKDPADLDPRTKIKS